VPSVLEVLCQILRKAAVYFPHAPILPCKPGFPEAMIFTSEGESCLQACRDMQLDHRAWPTAEAMRVTQMTVASSALPVLLMKMYYFFFEILLLCSESKK